MYDHKDVLIIAQAIKAVRPDSISQTARLILRAAMECNLVPGDLERAIEWWRGEEVAHNVR